MTLVVGSTLIELRLLKIDNITTLNWDLRFNMGFF
jgi:hypothetical protein